MITFKNISKITAVIMILFGCCVIIGWIFNITVLKSVLPDLVAVKSNTAVAFILIGISLWFCKKDISQPAKYIAQICALLVVVIGLLSLSEYLFGWDLGIDQLFFKESITVGTSNPGRMAPSTAFNFFIIGVALILINMSVCILTSQLIALLALMIGFLNFIGYIYGVEAFYSIANYTQMAVSTAAAFIIVGIGIFFIKYEQGLAKTISSKNTGSKMARRLVFIVLLVIPLIGWLRLAGQHMGLYETEFGTAALVSINTFILIVVIWINANWLNKIDIEQKQMQEKLLTAERLIAIGQFSGNIAHEIRNPLATIDSSVFYLKEKLKDAEEKVKEHLNRIKSSTDSASAIIQSVLNMTRMKEPQLETGNLTNFISDAVTSLKLPDTINVIQNFYEGQIIINTDREQIYIVFKNIIKNAIEAMDYKGTLTITARKTPDDKIEISFADTGSGIAPENISKIFEPLFTTKAKGIGFGLSMSKMIVEKHHGTIEAKSVSGKGTTITVKLPLKL